MAIHKKTQNITYTHSKQYTAHKITNTIKQNYKHNAHKITNTMHTKLQTYVFFLQSDFVAYSVPPKVAVKCVASCFLFRRSRVQISALTPSILTKVFKVSLSPSEKTHGSPLHYVRVASFHKVCNSLYTNNKIILTQVTLNILSIK
jgi:hypothetical protein